MKSRVVRELGMEGAGQKAPLANDDGMALVARQHLGPGAVVLYPGGADEHGPQRVWTEPLDLEILLEALALAAEGVSACDHVPEAQVLAVEHDHPRAGAEDRATGFREALDGPVEPVTGKRLGDRRRLAAGYHETVEILELARGPHL